MRLSDVMVCHGQCNRLVFETGQELLGRHHKPVFGCAVPRGVNSTGIVALAQHTAPDITVGLLEGHLAFVMRLKVLKSGTCPSVSFLATRDRLSRRHIWHLIVIVLY